MSVSKKIGVIFVKRIVALPLVIILTTLVFCGCNKDINTNSDDKSDIKKKDKIVEEVVDVDYTLYRPYIESAIDAHKTVNSYTSAQGIMYDIDDNGIKELLIIHEVNLTCVYDIYTIKDNTVHPLLEDKVFFFLAGGPSGDVYVMKDSNGEKLIGFRYTEVNPGDNTGLYYLGTWDVFLVNDTELSEVKSAEYTYITKDDVIDYSISTATIDSKEIPYKDFEDWLAQYESELLLSAYGFDEDNRLEDLLQNLS